MKNVRQCWTAALFILIFSWLMMDTAFADGGSEKLKKRIDQAAPGETVLLPPGEYEGPLRLVKPVILKAEHPGTAVLTRKTDEPALRIEADGVTVSGLQIADDQVWKSPAVWVEGDRVKLDGLTVRAGSTGIALREANDGEISNSLVEWNGELSIPLFDRGNGIDLYKSPRGRVIGNTVRNVYDAIYIESSDETSVIENRVEHSRYGVHFMYSNQAVIRGNTGEMNITGAMIMTVRGAVLSDNAFAKQSENVHSQGILLYDAHESAVLRNAVEGNRVGLYIEESNGNRIEDNLVDSNFIGIQLLSSKQNAIHGNTFIRNVVDAQAQSSEQNAIEGNYWDAFRGIDTDGDGRSNIRYAINPFFQELASKRPAFQLFFQSPGILFLENLYQSEQKGWAQDVSPLMKPPDPAAARNTRSGGIGSGLAGLFLLGAACVVIIFGRRKRS